MSGSPATSPAPAARHAAATPAEQPEFLPVTPAEVRSLGWEVLDILLISGDAYVDHPSFGVALLGRWLVSLGYRVGIVAQPDWRSPAGVARLGRPRLFAGVTAGSLDSMLAHYTAFRKRRSDDAYTPGGRAGARPNRAVTVYANLVRQAFPGLPLVVGGIEASMRRASHYDFWTDSLRRSVLLDSKADVLVYGMAERALADIARRLASRPGAGGAPGHGSLAGIPGTSTVLAARAGESPRGAWVLPSHEEILARPALLVEATLSLERHARQYEAAALQSAGARTVVIEPPARPLDAAELDALHALPFRREAHPSLREPVPALETVRFSVTTHRGCSGGCSFCSLALHQGRAVASRSADSVVGEVRGLARHPAWAGSLSDVGGPTANMWGARCDAAGPCRRASCLTPAICRHYRDGQTALTALLRRIAALPGVRHVRTASGVRHDLALRNAHYLRALVGEFTGGQLKLAPEHCTDRVLRLMRKPSWAVFERFLGAFETVNRERGRDQYVVPYLISGFPGCTEDDMRALADWLRLRGWRPRQVQCFVPTPGTLATAMYWAGADPDGRPIHVARSDAERLRQHALLSDRGGSRR